MGFMVLAESLLPPDGNVIIDGHIAMGIGLFVAIGIVFAPLLAALSAMFTLMGFAIIIEQFGRWCHLSQKGL